MPINLKAAADFWARIKGDSATAGDGTSNTAPARYDSWNQDIGSSDDSAASSNTGTFSLIALFKRLLNVTLAGLPTALGQSTMSASMRVAIASDQSAISVTYTPSQVRVSATLTRPGDTSAYGAKDAIANSTSSPSVITLSGVVASAGQSAYITRALCRTSQTAFTGQLRLHLYDTAPTAINDNAQFTILDANTATYLGFIDFLVFSTEGTGSDVAQAVGVMDNNGNLPIITNGATAIYGMLETITAFTPANAQVFKFTLIFDRG